MAKNDIDLRTLLAQAGHPIDPSTGAIIPPIHTASTFARDADYELIGPDLYSRYSSPTVREAEALICQLEGGAGALLFGSGLAAIAAIFETVKSGDHVVLPEVMYFGAQAWLTRHCAARGIALSRYDQAQPDALAAAIRPGETALVWVETPTNPTWDVVDIAAAADAAHAAGAVLGVDGTCAPPSTTRALALGADLVFHSATKYLNGHSDLTAGVVVAREPTDRWTEIETVRTYSGGVLGGFEAWLLIRGMRTLFVRFERASESAMAFAEHFSGYPAVETVLYPGLSSHPRHSVAARQMTGGFGGMLSVIVKADAARTKRIAGAFKVFVPATSLGGVESLVEHRKTVEGPTSTMPDGLLRFSVGLEAIDDLIADFEQALQTA